MRKLLIIGFLSIIKRLITVETLWENKCLKANWNFPSVIVNTDRDSQSCTQIASELSVWEQLVCGIQGKNLVQPLSAAVWQLSLLLGTEAGRNYFNCRVHDIKRVSTDHGWERCTGVGFGVSEQKPACEENRRAQSPALQPIFSVFSCIKTRDKPAAVHTHGGILWLPAGLRCGTEASR